MIWTQKSIQRLNILATCISIIVLLVVVFMRQIHFESTVDFRFLPKVYSTLNAICALVLIAAFIQIKKGNILNHKRLMTTAMIISLVFLVCYVIYHVTTPEVRYCKTGAIRYVYFSLLISHVVLSGLSFPFILFTYVRGLTMQVERHKKLSKIMFPIWLYICLSGPLCYVLLYPCINN
jgi:putative membrane protein